MTTRNWMTVLLLTATAAGAQEASPAYQAETRIPDTAASPRAPDRPFLYSTDPSLPASGEVVVSAGVGNVTRTGEIRPVGAGPIVPTAGAEVGVTPRLSLFAEGGAAFASTGAPLRSPMMFQAGAHVLLTNPASAKARIALQAYYGLDFQAASTAAVNATLAYDLSAVRVLASVTASHTFSPGRDPLDLAATMGATVKLPAGFRAGAEVVATDLEELGSVGAEGGATTFAGPTVGWEWNHRVQVVAGPALGIVPGSASVPLLGRAAASVHF